MCACPSAPLCCSRQSRGPLSKARPALFLDRDGILLEVVMRGPTVSSARSWAEFRLVAGARQMAEQARQLGWVTILATNQPDVARGLLSASLLAEFHERLAREVPLDGIEVCCEDGEHRRRKPNPGMLLDAAAHANLDLHRSFFLGDRRNDVLAALAAGVQPILLSTAYNEQEAAEFPDLCKIADLQELPALLRSAMDRTGHNP